MVDRGSRLASVFLACVALLACVSPQYPIALVVDGGRYGYVGEGSRFGVSVGADRKAAFGALTRRGFDVNVDRECEASSLHLEIGCQPGEIFDVYDRHRGLGHDTVFLEIRDGRVIAIGWFSEAVQMDF
ncbi:MAG TPA: hypothetical protein VG841_02460 [Caulobacterales bacterium]|nr:hypothetical protein [Caulobacterales bacterium]